MYKQIIHKLILGLLLCGSPAMWATEDLPLEQMTALRREVEALKQGHQTIGHFD